ncbi:PREDICTED: uncharacterized protein LOC109166026 [Ipomoea nil]|uniref:uncharacterized protein LOC109166026 n=1 Tax=Ipomoea nil TaxID=35883 RepID=UPI000900C5EC|nr:PREDICTED: uncharacterized protein LOC109166026 [Ipomoea nil]
MSFKDELNVNMAFFGFGCLDDPSKYESDDDEVKDEEVDKDCPTIHLTKAEKSQLRMPWIQSLIIKLWGRTVSYNYLLHKLKAMWNIKSHFDLLTLDNNYYLVRFSSAMEYALAKQQGPWMILDHYLIVKEWAPNLKTDKVGKKIGRPIKADMKTMAETRGRFARLLVEFDIMKPLLAKFKVRNSVRIIESEGAHLICFHCGVYGHWKEACPNVGGSSEIQGDEETTDREGGVSDVS